MHLDSALRPVAEKKDLRKESHDEHTTTACTGNVKSLQVMVQSVNAPSL
jgi:hypothetical protein